MQLAFRGKKRGSRARIPRPAPSSSWQNAQDALWRRLLGGKIMNETPRATPFTTHAKGRGELPVYGVS